MQELGATDVCVFEQHCLAWRAYTPGRMAHLTLEEFIEINRDELINRCRTKVSTRSPPPVTRVEDDFGVPLLLDQVVDELRHGRSATDEITRTATKQGNVLLREGFTVGQVVHGYGDVCQSVTELAVELSAPISSDDFRTLNRCLDDAIAGAVTEHARERAAAVTRGGLTELGRLADVALVAVDALQTGNVGLGGSTGALLLDSLKAIRALADRPLSEGVPPQPR